MTNNAFLIVRTLLGELLKLFNSWYLPGTHVTPLSLMILIAFTSFFISFVKKLTNQDSNISGIVKKFRKNGD